MLQSINPYTNILIAEYQEDSPTELDELVACGNSAFTSWKKLHFKERIGHFSRLIDLLHQEKDIHAALISNEMGKPFKEAQGEIEKCVGGIDYYINNIETFLQSESLAIDTHLAYVTYEPLGVILALMPWNFPYWQVFRCTVPALLAGNTVLVKSAPTTTGCALAMQALIEKAGFPKGVFQVVKIQNETSGYLIAKKEIMGVSLTGSERAGEEVGAIAGKHLKKLVMELGGSDPFIVLEDANLELSVSAALKSRVQNAGQSCVAAKRFILSEKIAASFTSALMIGLEAVRLGDPMNTSTTMGPMAHKRLKEGLVAQVESSISMGAKMVFGSLPSSDDNFFAPIVLSSIKAGMPAYEEELFGPVFSIIETSSVEETIRIANDTKFGLGASIWSADLEAAQQLAHQLEVGMVFFNEFVHSDVRLPFGGVKRSGYGRELGAAGAKEFVQAKTHFIG